MHLRVPILLGLGAGTPFRVLAAVALLAIASLVVSCGGNGPSTHTPTASATAALPSPIDSGTPKASQVPPGPDVTPVPGSTPDTTQPFWEIPYLNQDRLSPKLHGTINGIEVGRASGPTPSCAGVTVNPDFKITAGTPFQLQLGSLPQGVTLSGPPRIAQCPDGRVIWLTFDLTVAPGVAGANTGGGGITVWRWADVRWVPQEAPAERWAPAMIAGRPAALLQPLLEHTGQSAVIVSDSEINGSTTLLGVEVSLGLVEQVAEALYTIADRLRGG